MFHNILEAESYRITKVKVFMPFYDILVKFDLYKVGKLDPVVVSELFNDERNIDGMMDK